MMKRWSGLLAALLLCLGAAAQESGLRETLFAEADEALAAARDADAELLAPESFEDGMEAYMDAEDDLSRGRNVERIRERLREAVEAFHMSVDAAEIAEVTLASMIKTRDDASAASAETFARQSWSDAEDAFDDAARQLESGDIRDARERASEAEKLYRDAELTAIKAQYLSQTRALLAEAEQMRVPRYAPKTYMRAQSLLERAEQELNENRYDTDLPRSLAQQANYEARHAIRLAGEIQGYRDRDATEEDIILHYEEPLTRVAAAADKVAPLDEGVDPVVDDLVDYIEQLRERAAQNERDLEDSRTRIAELEDEIRELDERLGGISQERVALVQRLEAENRIREQFDTIENMFTRDEARISREGNNLVLSLVGLTFESGSAKVADRYRGLLEKVSRAAGVFPRSQLIIEGHTDSYGNDDTNMSLSRQRAQAVSDYLNEEFGIQQFRMSVVGYGETRPIANNETPQGRARNRRIDVRIEPQIE